LADKQEVFIEDAFEFPDDDHVDADPSDDVENGLDKVGNDTPDNNFIDINNHDVANANEADDPAEFEPDGLKPGANDEDGADTGGKYVFDHNQRSVEPEANENPNTNRYNLRSDRGRTYDHRLAHQMDDPENTKSYESGVQMLQQAADSMHESPNNIYKYICGHMMTR